MNRAGEELARNPSQIYAKNCDLWFIFSGLLIGNL